MFVLWCVNYEGSSLIADFIIEHVCAFWEVLREMNLGMIHQNDTLASKKMNLCAMQTSI